MKRVYRSILTAMALAMLVASAVPAAAYNFSTLIYPGAISSGAYGINDSGQIVGEYFVLNDLNPKGFIYANGQFTPFNVEDATGTTLNGINNAGDLVGSYSTTAGVKYPFLSSGGKLTPIILSGANWGEARSINKNGVIVGDCIVDGVHHGFKYENGTPAFLDYSGAVETRIFGINDAGTMVGEFKDHSNVWRGFIQQNGQYQPLEVQGAVETRPNSINNSGQIVGFYSYDNDISHGFIYTHGTFTTLDFPGASTTEGSRINNYGLIVGWYDNNGFQARPVSVSTLGLLLD